MGSVIGYPEAHGAVATFETDIEDKVKSLIVNIEPVQDLHGYDHPWPAGGGKNILPYPYYSQDGTLSGITFSTAQDGKITASGTTTEGVNFFLERDISLAAGTYTLSIDGTHTALTLLARNPNAGITLATIAPSQAKATFTLAETTNVRLYFNTSVVGASVSISAYVQLEAGSTATSYAPYSNICPITGWTGATITHHGKNMAQYWQQGYIGTDGTIKTGLSYAIAKPIFVQNGRPIAVSNTAGDYQGIAVFSDSSLENMIYRLANTASTYTASQDCYVVCWFNKVYSEYTESDFVDRGVQIEFSYSPTNYEPYSHDEYDIEFPSEAGTAYGGMLDVVKGELVVDRAMVKISELAWAYMANYAYMNTQSLNNIIVYPTSNTDTLGGLLCSAYKTGTAQQAGSGNINGTIAVNTSGDLRIKDNSYTDPNEWKTAQGNQTIVYPLATPITYQLTPQEVRTIIGTNTIYADTGDVSVLYPKTLIPSETVSNVSLMELRRNIMMAMQHNYIPEITTYGVEWNYNDPSTVLKRTGAASKFANPIPAESLNEVGWSPFDNVYPWSEMKRYNIINGEVAYSEDDVGYSETDYDTMVYIPEFYYYANKDTLNQKWSWSISAKPLEGYEKHPGSGRYVGRFHTSGSSSGVYSKSDASPLASISRANFRTYSHNKGSKWWQIDLATWSAIQLLYLIEFANWNSQSVLGLGDNNGEYPENTGGTNGLLYHSIKRSDNANAYRSIENPFSNLLIFIDGIVAYNKRIYTTTNTSNYSESYSTMQNTNISLPNIGFIKNIAYSSICPFAFIPNESFDGDGSTYVSDTVESGNVNLNHMAAVGGNWNQKPKRGLFFISCANEANIVSNDIGSRLMFIPST